MDNYNYQILEGKTKTFGEYFKLPKARAVFYVASRHPDIRDVECFSRSNGDEIITMYMTHLEVPSRPYFPIAETEKVAIICHPEDLRLPEVYALRKDFPTGLPHSNAQKFARPVSLCVSDVCFADIRPQFNAYAFLTWIRRWFSLNSKNQLHEKGRPLDVFFSYSEACCLLNKPKQTKLLKFIKYKNKTLFSSTLENVEEKEADHCLIPVLEGTYEARNFLRIPQKMSELEGILTGQENTILNSVLRALKEHSHAHDVSLTLFLLISVEQVGENGKNTSQDLFLIKTKTSPHEVLSTQQRLYKRDFEKWFGELHISVAVIRDMNSSAANAWFNGIKPAFKKIGFIGAGTLGSALIDHFVREGVASEIKIVDPDVLYPHNLSRHILPPNMVMTHKAESLSAFYDGFIGQKVIPIVKDFLSLTPQEQRSLYSNLDLLVDLSTSIAVERRAAAAEGKFRRCTAFINPKGDELVLLFEDEERKHTLDLLEMDYLRNLIVDERFSLHLESGVNVRTNNFSCRSESAVLNFENIRLLAAITSNQIRNFSDKRDACIKIWHFDNEKCSVSDLEMSITNWHHEKVGSIEVLISDSVVKEIQDMSESSPDCETGGCLFGSYDQDFNKIYVYYMLPAPEDSVREKGRFIRGNKGVLEEQERISKLTYNQVRYLGEWHSHPNELNVPSPTDKEQFEKLRENQKAQDLPVVRLIYGKNGLRIEAEM